MVTSQTRIMTEPCSAVADKVHRNYNNELKSSLLKILEICNNIFNSEFMSLTSLVNSIIPERKLNPELYFRYFNILQEIECDNGEQLKKELQQFPTENLYRDTVLISGDSITNWQSEVTKRYESYDLKEYEHPIKFHPLPLSEFTENKKHVEGALAIIKALDTEFYHEIENFLGEISLNGCDTIVGVSAPEHFGLVFIAVPIAELEKENALLYYIEHITHETSHLFLHAVSAQDALTLNDPAEKYPAPIRKDLRPIYGIFHATFVLSRIIRIFRKLINTNGLNINMQIAKEFLEKFDKKFASGCKVLEENARFTDLGRHIFLSIEKCAYES